MCSVSLGDSVYYFCAFICGITVELSPVALDLSEFFNHNS